nr:EAL domain-containing protein [Nakamurella aerolata]
MARWRHPLRGVVSPDVFVQQFGRNGQAARLFTGVVHLVACQVKELGGIGVPVAVNIDGEVTQHRQWHRDFLELLAVEDLPPTAVTLELTERIDPAGRPAWWYAAFDELAAAGVRLALDDVGHGIDRTELLMRLPIATVKLDRSILDQVCRLSLLDRRRAAAAKRFLEGIAHWCSSNDIATVAEGISSAHHASTAVDAGWLTGQGYWLGRPTDRLATLRATPSAGTRCATGVDGLARAPH